MVDRIRRKITEGEEPTWEDILGVLEKHEEALHDFARSARWALRSIPLILLFGAIGNGWLLDQNGKRADENAQNAIEAKVQAYEASFASCISGADMRILVAKGFDGLRRGAVPGDATPRDLLKAFYMRTQPPIDDLLTQAAYERESSLVYRATTRWGEITDDVEGEVRKLARRRCVRRTREQFPGVVPKSQ